MTMLDLKLTPRRAALLEGHDTEVHVLVSIAAPEAPPSMQPRAPLNLAIVLDRSGSMSGRPLAEAKKCAAHMVRGLSASDRVALVAFDHDIETIAESQRVVDPESVLSRLRTIETRGNTNLHGGWLLGAESAAAHVAPGALSRVILLTDGQANAGETDPRRIAEDCSRLAAAGVATSTYGLGVGFNEDLLQSMAQSGGGRSYFGETADDLMDPFREEFDLMRAMCARRIRIGLEPAAGVDAVVVNLTRRDPDGRTIVPDVAYGGVAWALVKLRVPATLAEPGRGDVHVLSVDVTYESNDGALRSCAPAHLRLPRVPAAAFGAIAEDPVVAARQREARGAELQDFAREAAQHGDWDRVDALIAEAQEEAADNEWAKASLEGLQRIAQARDAILFSKEAAYKSMRMKERLYHPDEGARYSPSAESSKPSYLRRKPREGKKLDE